MKESYFRAMDVLAKFCLVVSAACLVTMTIIIPWGVFTRYVLGYGSSWPEPMAILLMIIFTFFSACACYRDGLHISVMALPDAVSPKVRRALGYIAEASMITINLFMVIWGGDLVFITWHQDIGEFPIVTTGMTYLSIPVGGAIMVLLIIERIWKGNLFPAVNASLGAME